MNTIKAEIDRLTEAKNNIRNTVNSKGVYIPAEVKLDSYYMFINDIQNTGSGSTCEKIAVSDAYYLFYQNRFINDLERFDFTDCSSFRNTFSLCEQIDLSKNTFPNSSILQSTFSRYQGTSVDLSTFNHEKVLTMQECFSSSSITSLDLTNFVNCYDLNAICTNCSNLIDVRLQMIGLNNSIQALGSAFAGCTALEFIELRDLNTTELTNLSQTFANCKSLREINLNAINTEKCTTMTNMFNYCTALEYVDNFSCTGLKATTNIFTGCSALKVLRFKNNEQIGSTSSTATITLNLAYSPNLNYDMLINSLGANTSGHVRQIKLNTTLYNSLTAEQIAEAEKKNYTLTYGTS